jgi:hypothetical protein
MCGRHVWHVYTHHAMINMMLMFNIRQRTLCSTPQAAERLQLSKMLHERLTACNVHDSCVAVAITPLLDMPLLHTLQCTAPILHKHCTTHVVRGPSPCDYQKWHGMPCMHDTSCTSQHALHIIVDAIPCIATAAFRAPAAIRAAQVAHCAEALPAMQCSRQCTVWCRLCT